MDIGQRLRQARLEAGLSQRQLCDGIVTRNMLSQIENGSAQPSMATLQQFAARLGKTIGYFLEEEAVTSPNQTVMAQARSAYSAGQYRQVLDILEAYREPDGVFDWERWLLDALARLCLAEEVLREGKNAYAVTLLEQAGEAGSKTPYYTPSLEQRRLLLCYRARPGDATRLAQLLPEDTETYLLRAHSLLDTEPVQSLKILDAASQGHRDSRWHFLRGQAYQKLTDYEKAVKCYRAAEEAHPRQVWPLLEECYRELGDFEHAYKYACLQK